MWLIISCNDIWISTLALLTNDIERLYALNVHFISIWKLYLLQNIVQIKVSLITDNVEQAYIVFDALVSSSSDWFNADRITASFWSSLMTFTGEFNYFSISG